MTIAKPGSYLSGYVLGTSTIKIWRKKGWAIGKGNLKRSISMILYADGFYYGREADKGFVDALLDSIN